MFPRRDGTADLRVAQMRHTIRNQSLRRAKRHAEPAIRWSPHGISGFWFDSGPADTRLPGDAALSGERRCSLDAAGRAGSLRGPRRVFFYARWLLGRPCGQGGKRRRWQPFRVMRAIKISHLDQKLLTVLKAAFIRKNDAGSLYSGQAASIRLVLEKQLFFTTSERPHECQIGSGEAIRTAVRMTFESRWTWSSDSFRLPRSAALFGMRAPGARPALTQLSQFKHCLTMRATAGATPSSIRTRADLAASSEA